MIKVPLNRKSLETQFASCKASVKSSVLNEYALLRRRAGQYKPQVDKFKEEARAKFTTLRSRLKTRLGTH